MNSTLRTVSQVLSILAAIAALVAAVIATLDYLGKLPAKEEGYTEFPPEYDDYADWDEG